MTRKLTLGSIGLLCGICLFSQQSTAVLEARVQELIGTNGTGSAPELSERLNRMGERDQAVRTAEYMSQSVPERLVREQERTDRELTAELIRIVAENGWPTVRLVGFQASENAALLLMHSRDRLFQKRLLPRLQQVAQEGMILSSSIAFLVDKILVAEGKPQRFGTQVRFANGVGEILPVEDLPQLEERRAKNLLPPMQEYKKTLSVLYGVKIR